MLVAISCGKRLLVQLAVRNLLMPFLFPMVLYWPAFPMVMAGWLRLTYLATKCGRKVLAELEMFGAGLLFLFLTDL